MQITKEYEITKTNPDGKLQKYTNNRMRKNTEKFDIMEKLKTPKRLEQIDTGEKHRKVRQV